MPGSAEASVGAGAVVTTPRRSTSQPLLLPSSSPGIASALKRQRSLRRQSSLQSLESDDDEEEEEGDEDTEDPLYLESLRSGVSAVAARRPVVRQFCTLALVATPEHSCMGIIDVWNYGACCDCVTVMQVVWPMPPLPSRVRLPTLMV